MNDNIPQDATVDQNTYSTREEYMEHLRRWVENTRDDMELSYSTWYTYNLQVYEQYYQQGSNTNTNAYGHVHEHEHVHGHAHMHIHQHVHTHTRAHVHAARFRASSVAENVGVAYIYTVPPMWKRIIAEAIDFMVLFVIKLFLTVVVVQNLDIIDIEKYGLNIFEKTTENPNLMMQMSMEILFLEIVHRFIGCIYETYWITVYSATPGKRYMGLVVLHVVTIANIQGQPKETVIAHPCTRLSIKDAIFRSLLKNLFVGLLLPICFILMFFKYNRTGYDVITNCLVVEYNPNPPIIEIR